MITNAVDLRSNMKDIMSAIERKEKVTILYHGKEKAVISAIDNKNTPPIKKHAFFGMLDEKQSVESTIDKLRGLRY